MTAGAGRASERGRSRSLILATYPGPKVCNRTAFRVDGDNIMPPTEDRRLVRLTKICIALPEASREITGDHASFRVRTKTFGYFLNNHHGDGIVSVCCKSALGENVDRASREPARFYLPPYIGPRGWFGLRLDGEAVDWSEVKNLLELSYGLVAPKRLLLRT